jgi:transcriptional regulator with XRE-family HTH domain
MKQNYKNPLGLAFGSACRAERKAMNFTMDNMAEKLGIKPSFYKLVENGTNYLHVNKTPSIVKAFNNAMSLDGVSKILLAISHSEAMARQAAGESSAETHHARYLEGFLSSIKQLSEMDKDKLGRLLLPYQQLDTIAALSTASAKEAKITLAQHALTNNTLEFLKNYTTYGDLESGLQSNALVAKLESVPSMYLDFVSDFVTRLSHLPAKVGFEEMWRWEAENISLLKEYWCIINDVESIVSETNLSRYHFNHLWSQEFEKSRILFVEPACDTTTAYNFRSTMKSVLEKSMNSDTLGNNSIPFAKNKLVNFDSAMKKFLLKSMPSEPSKPMQLMRNELLPDPYQSFWVFKLTDNTLAGFYAKITGRSHLVPHMLTEGISLDHKQTTRKLDILMKLWSLSGIESN